MHILIIAKDDLRMDAALFLKTALWLKNVQSAVVEEDYFYEYLKINDFPDRIIWIGGGHEDKSVLYHRLTKEVKLSGFPDLKDFANASIRRSPDGKLTIITDDIFEVRSNVLPKLIDFYIREFISEKNQLE